MAPRLALLCLLTVMLGACGGGAPAGDESTSAGGAGAAPAPAAEVAAAAPEVTYEGIDVSHYQGTVDWTQVKAAGIHFAFAKATQGTANVDPEFAANWQGMRAAGLVRGAYHYLDPDQDATAQAEHFLATVQLEAGDLPPVLDVEVAEGMSVEGLDAAARTWLEKVAAATGVQPILYSDESFLDTELAQGFGAYPLWIAAYSETPPAPPSGWTAWTFWQFSETGQVSGVDGAVDRDRYQGTEAGFRQLLVRAVPVP